MRTCTRPRSSLKDVQLEQIIIRGDARPSNTRARAIYQANLHANAYCNWLELLNFLSVYMTYYYSGIVQTRQTGFRSIHLASLHRFVFTLWIGSRKAMQSHFRYRKYSTILCDLIFWLFNKLMSEEVSLKACLKFYIRNWFNSYIRRI